MVTKLKQQWAEGIPNKPGTKQKAPVREIVIRGAPDDRGVMNVGGRVGAARGPEALRKTLGNFMLGMSGELRRTRLLEGSNVDLLPTIESTHNAFARILAEDLRAKRIPIALGGGHDYGYPHVAACAEVFGSKRIALINVDAHLDVREINKGIITSGSPYYLALENGVVAPNRFVEFGIQEHCNDQKYADYVRKKKVKVQMLDECRKAGAAKTFAKTMKSLASKGTKLVVSFDVDAVTMASAPGVSAPQADGFTSGEFLEFARLAGENPNVVSIGFFELSPPLDHMDMTSRLVATAIHRFACGVDRRR